VGHHSERKARRDQGRMRSAMDAAVKAQKAVSYWNYRAEGVERHANRKANSGVRSRRIKTLLADLRDRQRGINHAFVCLDIWAKLKDETDEEVRTKLTKYYAGAWTAAGSFAPQYSNGSLWSDLCDNKISDDNVIEKCINHFGYQVENPYTLRWISHILNRLAFERSELGEICRFDGELTPAILQVFVRTHGADKPKAVKTDNGSALTTLAPLPLHIGLGTTLELSENDWCNLMLCVGYEVPAKKAAKPSILNFETGYIKGQCWGSVKIFRQIILTKGRVFSD